MEDFDALVESYTSDRETGILGVVLLAVDHDAKSLYSKASGHTSLSSDANPISETSIFRLASCTKLITSIAALQLAAQGKFGLDDSSIIEKHLPELCTQEIVTSAPGQPLTFKPRTNPITLRQLLTHTSGIGYDITDPRLQAWRKSCGETPKALSGPILEAFSTPLVFEPGEGWGYGGGLDWVTVLIERVTGKNYGEWLRENVFDVVGVDARVGFVKMEVEKEGEVVMTTTRNKESKLVEHKVGQMKGEGGGGGLFASPSNCMRILQDLISDYPKLLPKEMLDELFKPQLPVGSPSLKGLHTSAPIFAAMTGPLTASLKSTSLNHGLGGILITEDSEGLGKTKGTLSWGGAFNCVWFANREVGVAGCYMSAMYPPGDVKSGELMSGFMREVWRKVGERELR